jgi:glycosyltransferase involved in cell wall biosynthesis
MFISDKLVFVHLPKAAGSHISYLLSQILEGEITKRPHIPADDEHFRKGIPFIGSIRCPWQWYLSQWTYGCDNEGGIYKKVTSPRGKKKIVYNFNPYFTFLSFINEYTRKPEPWRNCYTNSDDAEAFRDWLRMVCSSRFRFDIDKKYGYSGISRVAGLMTYRYLTLYCKNPKQMSSNRCFNRNQIRSFVDKNFYITHLIRNENLEDDLMKMLTSCGIDLSDEQENNILNTPKTNTSTRKHGLEAIDSVLSQTLTDLEVVVIDDGSTDGTTEVVKAIDDPRIRYFYKDNGGVSSARNMGLDKAEGQYIAFLDSDDLYSPEYLKTMVTALEDNPDYGVAYTAVTNHYINGRVEVYRADSCCSGWITKELFDRFFLSQTCVIRASLAKTLFYDEQLDLAEDVDYFLQLSCKTKFLYVPQAQMIRRMQSESLSQANGTPKIPEKKIRVLERFYYELGGNQFISKRFAKKRFSRQYRKMGRMYHKLDARKAALSMLARSIRLGPFRFRNYQDYLLSYLKFTKTDTMPDWEILPPLGKPQRKGSLQ